MGDDEGWLPIAQLPHYSVSRDGRVRNNNTNKLVKERVNDKGFPVVVLYGTDSLTRNLRQVNTLVAKAFLPPPIEDDMTAVWHVDGDLLNCKAENLRWEFRNRVLEWNDQNRHGEARYKTPRVRNNRTGKVYDSAYDCAVDEGELESTIVWKCEKGSPRYVYIGVNDL